MFFKHEIAVTIDKPQRHLEPFILKHPKQAYLYAKQILKRRWKKAENTILLGSDASHARAEYMYLYAKNVLKRRWKEAEKILIKTAEEAVGYYWSNDARDKLALYAKNVIKGRWKEAESFIAKSNTIEIYLSVLDDNSLNEFRNMITLEAMGGSRTAKRFFSWKPTHTVKMKGSKAFGVMLNLESDSPHDVSICHNDAYGPRNIVAKHYHAYTLSEWISNSSNKLEYNPKNKKWYWSPKVTYHHYNEAEGIFQGTVTPIG